MNKLHTSKPNLMQNDSTAHKLASSENKVMITLVRAYLADTLCKRKNERKKRHREQSQRMTSGHKSLVDLKMTSREAL